LSLAPDFDEFCALLIARSVEAGLFELSGLFGLF
jgi:hypothetical protein